MEDSRATTHTHDAFLLRRGHVQFITALVIVTAMGAIALIGYSSLEATLERTRQSAMQQLVHDRVQTLRAALLESNKQVSDALLLYLSQDAQTAPGGDGEKPTPQGISTALQNTLGLDSFVLDDSGTLIAARLTATTGIAAQQVPDIVAHCRGAETPLTADHGYCLSADQRFVFHTFSLKIADGRGTLVLPESTSALQTLFQSLPAGADDSYVYLAVRDRSGPTLALGPSLGAGSSIKEEFSSVLETESRPNLSDRSVEAVDHFFVARQRTGFSSWEVVAFIHRDTTARPLRAYLLAVLSAIALAAIVASRLLLSLFRVSQ